MTQIPGLHHVTAISGPPQENVDFYTGAMGQRLVKKTVNFDDPGTYHLYYGDHGGTPGTILTFFPFEGAGQGRPGPGMASAYAYRIAPSALGAWVARTGAERVADRFGAEAAVLRDPDGAAVEVIADDGAEGDGPDAFHSVTLWLADLGPTQRLLTDVMGYEEAGHESADGAERLRLIAPGGARGSVVDLYRSDAAQRGIPGRGTIHHVAFRARSDDEQRGWQEALASAGHPTTPVIDRQYFNAIYFREPGGVLFEIATDPPGFTADEPLETLGQALKLPDRYEPARDRIEAILPPISARAA